MYRNLVGRRQEISVLEEALASPRPEMIAVVGRRRIGKTYLVRQVYGERICFEVTGLQHGGKAEQLENFVLSMAKYFPNYVLPKKPTSWLEAFHFLSVALEQLPTAEKKVVFLDELPWMGTPRSGFLAGLSFFWNSWASRQSIVVVICGSAASWMIKKVIHDRGGLHNRVTRLLVLRPFTLAETEAFCHSRGIHLNRLMLLQVYMAIGGVPMYLDQLRPGLSAMQNIQAICFSPSGYLRHEFDRLYASLFSNFQSHIAIVRALAARRSGLTRLEISRLARISNGGMLTDLLDELETSGFIAIYGGYGKKVKESLYRLTDAYSLFYLTFIEPLGKGSHVDFSQWSDLPQWKTWSGYAFENVCLQHIDQIRKALGISGMTTSISSFVAAPEDDLPGAQIDLLIDRRDQCIHLCEIKFSASEYKITSKDVEALLNKRRVFQSHTHTQKHIFFTLITPVGIAPDSHKGQPIDQVVTLDDLFAE